MFGGLGYGPDRVTQKIPVKITNLTNVIQFSCGTDHTVALKSDGTVWAFGNNQDGMLGDGTIINRLVPIQVLNLTNVKKISAGYFSSYAIKTDGTVWGWGQNKYRMIVNNGASSVVSPTKMYSLSSISDISGGGYFSLYLTNTSHIANNISLTTAQNAAKNIQLSGSDINQDKLNYSVVVAPLYGTLSGSGSDLIYTPSGNYSNVNDRFTFKVNDGLVDSNIATITIALTVVNKAPAIQTPAWADPNPITLPNSTTMHVIANDADSGHQALSYAWSKISGPGTVTFSPNGDTTNDARTTNFSLAGTYVLSVTVSDGISSITSNVSVAVKPIIVTDTTGPNLDVSSTIIKGTVNDSSGVASLTVNGISVTINADGT